MFDIIVLCVTGMILVLCMCGLIWEHCFIKNMTLEQACEIAINVEEKQKLEYSLSVYIQARKILLNHGYWKYNDSIGWNFLQNRAFNILADGDYIKDLRTGESIS